MKNNAEIVGALTEFAENLKNCTIEPEIITSMLRDFASRRGLELNDVNPKWHILSEEETLDEAGTALHDYVDYYIAELDDKLGKLMGATNIDDLMKRKQTLMNAMTALPNRSDTCPFCIMTNNDCDICDYAKKYGKCGSEATNSWRNMMSDLLDLRMAIVNYW